MGGPPLDELRLHRVKSNALFEKVFLKRCSGWLFSFEASCLLPLSRDRFSFNLSSSLVLLPSDVCSTSCRNGGTCVGPNTCSCPAGHTGKDCSSRTSVRLVMHLSIASPWVPPWGFDRFALPGGGEFDHGVGYGGEAH